MAQNGLKRAIKEAELFRRYVHVWQDLIEVSEELHQIALDPAVKEMLQKSANAARDVQVNALAYLRQADAMFTILDEKLGEFPRSV